MGGIGRSLGFAVALAVSSAMAAAAPLEVVKVSIATAVREGVAPAEDVQTLVYPSLATFRARLKGFEPGKAYAARLQVQDGAERTVLDESWNFSAAQSESVLSKTMGAYGAYPAGTWRFILSIDGAVVAEKTIVAVVQRPEVKPEHPPLQLIAATVSAAVTHSGDPYWPLQVVGTRSGFFYVVRARGFVPGQQYVVWLKAFDGEDRMFRNYRVGHTPARAEESLWYIFAPEPPPAPGKWRLRLEVDERLLAETTIEATSGAGPRKRPAGESRLLAGSALALLLVALYVGSQMYAFRRRSEAIPTGGAPAPGGRISAGAQDAAAPAILLAAVNLAPIAFVLLGWAGAEQLLFLYWAETLVVAVYTLLRMACARAEPPTAGGYATFIVGFGVFATVYLLYVLYFLQRIPELPIDPHGMIDANVADRFELPQGWLRTAVPLALVPQVVALFVSHGVSFVHHYLRGGECLHARASEEMTRPFDRMALLHTGIVLGGFFVIYGGHSRSTATLIALVLAKTAADVRLHLRAHARARRDGAQP